MIRSTFSSFIQLGYRFAEWEINAEPSSEPEDSPWDDALEECFDSEYQNEARFKLEFMIFILFFFSKCRLCGTFAIVTMNIAFHLESPVPMGLTMTKM